MPIVFIKEGKKGKNLYSLSEPQVLAILELRLQKLTALEREDIQKDLESLILEIKNYLSVLNSRDILLKYKINHFLDFLFFLFLLKLI